MRQDMRREVLNWNRKKNGSHWEPFLEFFNTAPVTDEEYDFILKREKKNNLKNFIRHSNSYFGLVRKCLNSIYRKNKFVKKNLTKIDNDFLNGKRINFRGFLDRLEKYPISETTWGDLIKTDNATGDFDKNKQNHIKQCNKIRIIANKLHEQDRYIKQKTDSFFAEEIEFSLDKGITKSKNDTSNVRENRLKKAIKLPNKIQIKSFGFKRNPDVVVEVLLRAKGVCEQCKKNAPFIRKKDNTPYLEVHHRVMLSDNGEDTVKNAIAICPNCHRKLHFGI